MEEVEKVKTTKVVKSSIMSIITATTLRDLIRQVNESKIKKEDIVTIIKDNSQFLLIYYK